MTLMVGVPTAVALGLLFGWRLWAGIVAALVWYACLAVQTAYLAHPGRSGFFGVDALGAVQGSGLGQYWVAQPLIAVLMAAFLWGSASLRSRRQAGDTDPEEGP
jgi:hypothetical protein